MIPPDAVLKLMRRQHGLVTRRSLLAAGCTPDAVGGMVRRGRLERVQRGVYRWPGGAVPPEQPVLAAVLRCGTEARAGGASALGLHSVEGFDLDGRPEVTVPPGRTITGVRFLVRSGPTVDGIDQVTVRGVPAVSAAVALLDAAGSVSAKCFRVAFDDARRDGLLTVASFESRMAAYPLHPGRARARAWLAEGVLEQESEGERALASALQAAPVQPEWGMWLLPDVRVDAVYRAARLVLEYDGRRHHTLEGDRDADQRRQQRLEGDGYWVERVRWEDLRDRPGETVARVEAVRRSREALLRG